MATEVCYFREGGTFEWRPTRANSMGTCCRKHISVISRVPRMWGPTFSNIAVDSFSALDKKISGISQHPPRDLPSHMAHLATLVGSTTQPPVDHFLLKQMENLQFAWESVWQIDPCRSCFSNSYECRFLAFGSRVKFHLAILKIVGLPIRWKKVYF